MDFLRETLSPSSLCDSVAGGRWIVYTDCTPVQMLLDLIPEVLVVVGTSSGSRALLVSETDQIRTSVHL